jgi:hypothetical protein
LVRTKPFRESGGGEWGVRVARATRTAGEVNQTEEKTGCKKEKNKVGKGEEGKRKRKRVGSNSILNNLV